MAASNWRFFKLKRRKLCFSFIMFNASIFTIFMLFLLSIFSITLNVTPNTQILRVQNKRIETTKSEAINNLEHFESHPMENECRFPLISNSEPDLKKYIVDLSNFSCPQTTNHTYFRQQLNGDVFVVPGDHQCFYRKLSGSIKPLNYTTFTYKNDWTKFVSGRNITVPSDQFAVQCLGKNLDTNETSLLVHDVFNNIRRKRRLNPPFVNNLNDPHKLSFVFLVLDSVSKTQFFRHMPKTLQFLNQNDFQIMNMYNKIGDNSLINLLSMLSGKVYESKIRDLDNLVRDEMSLKLNETRSDRAQELADMLLLTAKKRGYATMFNDDVMRPDLGLMQYNGWKGFWKPPADYYFRPYWNYLYRKVMPNGTCVNGELYSTRFIHTFERFSTVYTNQAHFSFNFITKLTHDSPSPLQLIDKPLIESFERLKQNGLFDNTVVILMGDHGQRISAIQYSYSGRIEERTPFFSIYIPEKYKSAYPDKYKQLKLNTNRLTSNFDIYETLSEMMQLPTKNVGTSLFETISTHRHCEHARIPPNFCMCMEELDPSILATEDKDFMTIMIADQFNQEINATSSCISDINDLRPLAFQPYTINLQARTSRSLEDFKKYMLKHKKAKVADNEIFEVEIDSEMFVNLKQKEKPVHVMARSRVLFNRKTKDMRIVSKPMLISSKCPAKSFQQMCQCTKF